MQVSCSAAVVLDIILGEDRTRSAEQEGRDTEQRDTICPRSVDDKLSSPLASPNLDC